MFRRRWQPIITRKEHEAVVAERDKLLKDLEELEDWRRLAATFQSFLDGKETLSAIRGRLNALVTTVDIKERKERNGEGGSVILRPGKAPTW